MLEAMKRGWWLLVLRGICAMVFGVFTFLWPGISLVTLVLLFGAYALVNGLFTIGIALRSPTGTAGTGALWLLGLLGVAVGVLTFYYPGLTAISLLLVIAWWAIATGIFEIAVAIRLRKQMSNERLLVLSGALSVVLGVFLIAMPGAGALSIVWLVGAYALLFGILMLSLAVKLKGFVSQARGATRLA